MKNKRSVYGLPDKDLFIDNNFFIFFVFMIFPLIGFFLVFRKAILHRRNLFTMGRFSIITGSILAFLNLLMVFLMSTEREVKPYSWFFIVMIVFDIALIIYGICQKVKASKYRKYLNEIVNFGVTDIDKIAKYVGLPYEVVITDIYKLIDQRYLEGYVIDYENRKVYSIEDKEALEKVQRELDRIVTCPNCGANNHLTTKYAKCRYCNSYIK